MAHLIDDFTLMLKFSAWSANMTVMRRAGETLEYLTSARVARILGITKRTLHNWIKAGKIPAPEVNPENGYLQWRITDIEVVRNVLTEESLDSAGNR